VRRDPTGACVAPTLAPGQRGPACDGDRAPGEQVAADRGSYKPLDGQGPITITQAPPPTLASEAQGPRACRTATISPFLQHAVRVEPAGTAYTLDEMGDRRAKLTGFAQGHDDAEDYTSHSTSSCTATSARAPPR
jgi:hypothetical protein